MSTDIDRSQVILYAVRCVVAGAISGVVLAVALYLGRDMDTASKIALTFGGGVLAMLSHGTAFWAQSPKQQLPPVVNMNITSIAPPALIPVHEAAPAAPSTPEVP